MKNLLFSLILLSFVIRINAQEKGLFIPVEFRSSYEKGIRNYDGTPGENYWQNHSDYVIEAKIDTLSNILSGREKIIYFNNSPDSLSEIVIRLFPDIFKKGNSRDFDISPEAVNDGVNIEYILIEGDSVNLSDRKEFRRSGTLANLMLGNMLLPNSSIVIEIAWSHKIPDINNIRNGTYGDKNYFIGYWHPQISVYDDIRGWSRQNYEGRVEMYGDFNNYDVKVSFPENFIVWGTGEIQNYEEVLEKKYVERIYKAMNSDSVVNIVELKDIEEGKITKQDGFNTWHFKAYKVTDFAFAASDKYLWNMTSFIPDSTRNGRVYVDAAYNPDSEDFYQVAEIARESLKFFSYEMPAYRFPFPKATVFNGEGGMEYPMMVNDGSATQLSGTVHLTSHELAHQYFPFLTGIDEERHAFMDEGWATMLPYEIQSRLAPGYDPIARNSRTYSSQSGKSFDMPLILPSNAMKGPSYRLAAYSRSGAAYEVLRDMLGTDLFLKAMKDFISNWERKHPKPHDFFFTFNRVTGKDLNWFWKPWFFEIAEADLELNFNELSKKITVKNIGGIPIPIKLQLEFKSGEIKEIYTSAEVWQNTSIFEFDEIIEGELSKIILGNDQIPDNNNLNNEISLN